MATTWLLSVVFLSFSVSPVFLTSFLIFLARALTSFLLITVAVAGKAFSALLFASLLVWITFWIEFDTVSVVKTGCISVEATKVGSSAGAVSEATAVSSVLW